MKRKAEHMLDRDNLSDDELPPSNTASNAADIATPEQIAQRRIVKLKMPSQIGGQGENGNRPAAKLELAGSLTSQNQPAANEPQAQQATGSTPSFLNKIITPTDTGAQQNNGSAQPQPSTGSSLFSNLLKKSAQEEGLAPKEEKKEEAKPSLFANLFAPKTDATPAPLFSGAGTGLFGESKTEGLFAQTNKPGGLFGSVFPGSSSGLANLATKDYSYVHKETGEKPKPEGVDEEKQPAKPQDKPAPLFASLANYKPPEATGAKPTLFGNLFSGTSTTFTSSLFNQQNSGLFSQNKDGEGSEGEDGDDEPQRTPSPEADITKSKGNYKYEVDYEKIISKKVTKFKPGSKNMLLEGEVSLNKNKDGNVYFIIYRNKAKLAQFQGQVIPKVSTIEYLNPRQDALSVKTYVTAKAEPTQPKEGEEPKENKPKISVEVAKIMFATPDECNEFKKELEKVLS